MSKTDENLKIAFADESQTNIEYLAYAHKAMEEGMIEIAQLFREAAGAEVVHALTHLKAMNVVKTTRENLQEAAKSFRVAFEREKHHRSMFRQALKQMG